ncbi:MAG: hypothetical protein M3321_05395 [Actinomycetota bacterium]|nr:hypothetical protein [Actinomycetota bacterium]
MSSSKGYPPFGATDVDIYIEPESFRETVAGDLPEKEADRARRRAASALVRGGQCTCP